MGFCKATNITGGAYIVAMLWLAISWFMILSPLYAVSFDQPVVGDARSCTRVLHGVDISYTKVAKVGCGYKTTYEWRALPCVSLPFFPYQDCAQKSIRIMITINGKSHSLPEVLVDKKDWPGRVWIWINHAIVVWLQWSTKIVQCLGRQIHRKATTLALAAFPLGAMEIDDLPLNKNVTFSSYSEFPYKVNQPINSDVQ